MDNIDKKLIQLLQENARYSLKQLSERVYLSSPAVAARIEKLKRDDMITGFHAEANLDKLGYHITTYIEVEMMPQNKTAFVDFVRGVPNVLECSFVSGSYTMLLKATFPATSDLDAFIEEVSRFGTTETHIVFSTPVPRRGVMLSEEDTPEEE